MGLADKLRQRGAGQPSTGTPSSDREREPLWKGPEDDGPQGGVTFSLLSRFLVCRERFRLKVVEGLEADHGFNHRIEYGNMWHACEEALATTRKDDPHLLAGYERLPWERALTECAKGLCRRYRTSQEQVEKWYNVCKVQFPEYVKFWEGRRDVRGKETLFAERVFNVPYRLPSGRTVRLRGKFDLVDLVTEGGKASLWLQEDKTKGDIDEQQLRRQLTFDLQTMLYLVALYNFDWSDDPVQRTRVTKPFPIKGVRYNVVRRPLSGGKGTIVKHKPTKSNPQGETDAEYYERLREIIRGDPGFFFMRWNTVVSRADVEFFCRCTLDPVLEQLCDWWDWMCYQPNAGGPYVLRPLDLYRPRKVSDGDYWLSPHWRHPFGVWNVLDEGGSSDVDEFLASGSEAGLRRAETLFPELEPQS